MPCIEDETPHLQIPLQHIKLATNGFAHENLIGDGGFGKVYKGVSEKHGRVAVKRLEYRRHGQGDREFNMEIGLLSKSQHQNIVSLIGFCDEDGEKILVYKHESNGSLDRQLNNKDVTWIQRLQICEDVARGLIYVGSQLGIIHRDVKSSNILLDETWRAKVSDFGLSKVRSQNPSYSSFVISNPCGTNGYIDPCYNNDGYLTQKSDVYSFGVVLWEVLCGRLTYASSSKDDPFRLTLLVQRHYKRQTLDEIIPSYLRKQMDIDSLRTFSDIAYQCLQNTEERPTMKQVLQQLQKALHVQQEAKKLEEEAKPTVEDEKMREELTYPSPLPPPSSQEVVLSVLMDCHACAKKIRKCLEGFEGIKYVHTDCMTHEVVVKGDEIDPLKVLERAQKNTHQQVKLLSSSVTKPPAKEPKMLDQEEPSKQEEKKYEPKPLSKIMVTLKVPMHCEGCARKIKKYIMTMKGVKSVVIDLNNSHVLIKGTFLVAALVDYVHKKTGKDTVIVKQDPIS
ncbi:hypothetical protein SSX86_020770 [Deinandra increscens subsp. villosa]|uniref:Protein kinase domain-containing protein n=1 Tax=Deinandra increscens subsp. villosa TaxID=3103831 RepID=A0AAP0CPX6_9ASTR